MIVPDRPLFKRLKQRAARCYVAGSTLNDALLVCQAWRSGAGPVTICAWNKDNSRPCDNARRCIAGIDALAAPRMDYQVALKLQDLNFSHDLTREVLDHASQCKVPVHFDAVGPDMADATLELLEDLHQGILGITIPGRWRRSTRDADRAVAIGLSVRIVKGQWADRNDSDRDLRSGFLAVVDQVAGRCRSVSVATHDPVLARVALERLRRAGTACELELLLGLPLCRMVSLADALDVPVRLYIPYGYPWLPYDLRHVLKKPWIVWWVLRDVTMSGPPAPICFTDRGVASWPRASRSPSLR
jgi:proline dehydrogenase